MMKKQLVLMLVAAMTSLAGYAQFEQGKVYVGGALSSLDLSYNGARKGSFGVEAKGGYLLDDNLMLTGQMGYQKVKDVPATFTAGVGGRYYIVQNGLFLGAGCNYAHAEGYDDFLPTVQVGYAFFLSRTVTVEPEIYYNQSFKNHSDFSTIGFRVGVGIYL